MEDVRERIISDWGADSFQLQFFEALLAKLKKGTSKCMSFSMLNKIAKEVSQEDINDSLSYFVGERAPILNLDFYFDEEPNLIQLRPEDVKEQLINDIFYHPYTGEEVVDFKDKVIIRYSATALFMEHLAK
ncbi:MAG: hypothetical protein NE327_22580 [Lentisphaeraceae bacterium]|nr:hypothetical protein [Lentisphaeraceae bacterium]